MSIFKLVEALEEFLPKMESEEEDVCIRINYCCDCDSMQYHRRCDLGQPDRLWANGCRIFGHIEHKDQDEFFAQDKKWPIIMQGREIQLLVKRRQYHDILPNISSETPDMVVLALMHYLLFSDPFPDSCYKNSDKHDTLIGLVTSSTFTNLSHKAKKYVFDKIVEFGHEKGFDHVFKCFQVLRQQERPIHDEFWRNICGALRRSLGPKLQLQAQELEKCRTREEFERDSRKHRVHFAMMLKTMCKLIYYEAPEDNCHLLYRAVKGNLFRQAVLLYDTGFFTMKELYRLSQDVDVQMMMEEDPQSDMALFLRGILRSAPTLFSLARSRLARLLRVEINDSGMLNSRKVAAQIVGLPRLLAVEVNLFERIGMDIRS